MPAPGLLALAWLLGLAAAAYTGNEPAAALAAIGLFGTASFAASPRPRTLLLVSAGALLILAAGAWYDAAEPQPDPVARLNCEPDALPGACDEVTLRAVVSREPVDRTSTRQYRLSVRALLEDGRWREESGDVLMITRPFPRYEYGDVLEITGELEEPPVLDGFNYRDYLLRRGISSTIAFPDTRLAGEGEGSFLRGLQIDIRSGLAGGVAEALPEPQQSLATGILLGDRSALDPQLAADMIETGTSHLTAVSGQNVAIVAAFVIAALAWAIGRRPAAWAALAALVAYSLVVGLDPSVFRAMIMGGIYVGAIITGRQDTAWYALILAGAAMTALDPHIVHDVSFQLSFAASLGLVILAGPLRGLCTDWLSQWTRHGESRAVAPVIELATVTLSAIAFTLPITALAFDRVSLVAPAANLFAVPAFVAVAATSALAGAIGAIPGIDAGFMVWLAWPPAFYMTTVVEFFALPSLATVGLGWVTTPIAAGYYGILLAFVGWLRGRQRLVIHPPERRPLNWRLLQPAATASLLIILASALVWLAATAPPSGRLSITFLDVGQGDAILVQAPSGHRILVDGGPAGVALERALDRHLPFYSRRIDLVVATHPQTDHIGGLPAVLDSYDVGALMSTGATADSSVYHDLRAAIERNGVPEITARRGQWIDLGDGARLTVLGPPPSIGPGDTDPNEASIVLRLTHGDVSLLLTGDITAESEDALLRAGTHLRADVLKVPHHGSRTSTSEPFLARTRPYVSVISVGESNIFGHPAPDVLQRLQDGLILRTDHHGDITIETDGAHLWVSTQRRSKAMSD